MTRLLPVCAVLLALPLVRGAEPQTEPTETVIRLTVQAAAAPKPALRYQLLPELREINAGNPLLAYLKCFMEQNNFFFNKQAVENREKWQTMPLKDLPLKEMRAFGYGTATRPLSEADYAARLDNLDWQLMQRIRTDGSNLLLPDLNSLRTLAVALAVRFRAEIAERRFDDALVTAKTMFALSRHLGAHPTLIGNLVGIAVAYIAIAPLDEMLQQPGCPNLYWALTDLPTPLLDLRMGLQGERMFLVKDFDVLDERAPMTDAQLRSAVDHIRVVLQNIQIPALQKRDVSEWLAARAANGTHVRAAAKRLVEYGLAEDRVKQFPPLQVVLLDEKLAYVVLRDDETKAMRLPYWQGVKIFGTPRARKADHEEGLLTGLTAGSVKVRQAQARLEQRFGLLRCVEALRLYAAEHGGQLPARLDDIKVPLPVDPITGSPFIYRLEGATATLQGTPPPGLEKVAHYKVRYEVTIAR
jgi:hypothetical protein